MPRRQPPQWPPAAAPALLLGLGGAGCGPGGDPLDGLVLVGPDPSDAPIAGLSAEWLDRFARGDTLFEAPFRETTGLGPAYIRASCAACHAEDGRGPGVVEKFVRVGPDGLTPAADQSTLPWGHTARPHVAGGASTPITIPDLPELLVTKRAPNAVFGRGYLEAVRADELLRVAAEQAGQGDDISGRVAWVPWEGEANPDTRFHGYGPGDDRLVGRFALKGRVSTLDAFAADALLGDMSITSPLRPFELPNPDGLTDDARPGVDVDLDTVNLLADYVRLLAIPTRSPVPGADVFDAVGCARCHVPTLRTEPDWPIAPLASIDAPIYSDLLLHDMGPAFSDGLSDFDAGPSEWRTAPLIGLRHQRNYLHDGRAHTVEEAIEAHRSEGAEGQGVMDEYDALSEVDRVTLIAFVNSL